MQLSGKLKISSRFLIAFVESALNFKHFEKKKKKKNEPHSSCISEVIDSQRGV